VLGIGLNLRLPETVGIDQPWTDLTRLGGEVSCRNALLSRLLAALLPALAQFEAEGLAPFQARWRRLDALAGCEVQVLDGARTHAGENIGIDERGALRLRASDGERVFASGEVSLRPA
jgi:BirA family biotin operon repressor/biotin-[acetyl-CoA-carboxylase] ligase